MARVFVATETALGRSVVIKVVAPEMASGVSAERFAREMKLAARLQQANIVPVLTTGIAGGLPYYTMPFVTGESLRARLKTGVPVSLPDAVNILRDVARALAFAHESGIVHRDIKPENILLSGGAAVVTDFGIAKAMTAARQTVSAERETLTQEGFAVGTPAYMAPEQVAADASVDHRADLYAWGLVAWELLAGEHPFADCIWSQSLVTAQLATIPRDVTTLRADTPAALSRLIGRCLAKDPEARPGSAFELITALDQVSTTGGGIPTRAIERTRRRRILPLGIIAGVAALALVAWLASRRTGRAKPDPAPRSLAVLPFESMGGDTANSYFAEGMAEEVATALAKVPGLQLAGRNSANPHGGKSPQEIGQLLGVGAVLQGSVRRAGERMRIAVELTNTSTGLVMWTERYEREVKDAFTVQDEIAREIVAALRMTLGTGGASAPAAGRGTADLAAYDDYLRGIYLVQRRGAGIQRAVEAFSAAIAKDSAFARANAGLGKALVLATEYADVPTPEVLGRATAAAERAVQLDPQLAEAYLSRGITDLFGSRWAKADSAFRRALELDPSHALAHQFYGRYLWSVGRIDQATEQLLQARALDPQNASVLGNLGMILSSAGRGEEAIAAARGGLAIDSMGLPAIVGYAHALVAAGRGEEARAFGARILQSNNDPRAMGAAAYALGRGGDTTGARTAYRTLDARRGEWRTGMARVRAAFGIGDTALALVALEDAIAKGEPVATNLSFRDPMFNPVRRSPRFAAMIRGFGLDPAVYTGPDPQPR